MVKRRMILETKKFTSVGFLIVFFESFGIVNFFQKDKNWKNNLQEVYCFIPYASLTCFMVLHFLSTITRSVNYLPHFITTAAEDVFNFSFLIQGFILRRNVKQLLELINKMEDSFSKVEQKVIRKFQKESKTILGTALVVVTFVVTIFNVEALLLPLPENETELWRKVYKTKFSERKLPMNIKIPFVDETEPFNYIVLFIFEALALYNMPILLCFSYTLMPILIVYLQSQYVILCKYIEQLGDNGKENTREIGNKTLEMHELLGQYRRRNKVNERFSYNNLHEKNRPNQVAPSGQYQTNLNKDHKSEEIHSLEDPYLSHTDESLQQNPCQRTFMRGIVKFHQELLTFNEKVCEISENFLM